jgi:RimJ/RimL family protein N-acetyltransferase
MPRPQDPASENTGNRFPDDIRLRGYGLVLREWTDQDVPLMVELFDDPAVDRFTPLHSPFDLGAARAYLERAREQRAADLRIQLAITTEDDRPRGEILLFRTGDGGHLAELAYAIGPRHRRQGLAARAVRLISEYAYTTLGMHRLYLRIPAENLASAAVAHATGFQRTGDPPVTRDGARYPLHTWQHHGPRSPSSR